MPSGRTTRGAGDVADRDAITAPSSSRSASAARPPPLQAAKPTTSAAPSSAQAQKPGDGRWRSTARPTAAVASGSTPVIDRGMHRVDPAQRQAEQQRKADHGAERRDASIGQCWRRGQGARVTSR